MTVHGTILNPHSLSADRADEIDEMPRSFKVFWSLHSMALVISICITVMYWGLLFDPAILQPDAINIMTHALNSVLMFLDMMIVSHPIRLFHVLQPVLFGIVYLLFSLVYYFCGGINA